MFFKNEHLKEFWDLNPKRANIMKELNSIWSRYEQRYGKTLFAVCDHGDKL